MQIEFNKLMLAKTGALVLGVLDKRQLLPFGKDLND